MFSGLRNSVKGMIVGLCNVKDGVRAQQVQDPDEYLGMDDVKLCPIQSASTSPLTDRNKPVVWSEDSVQRLPSFFLAGNLYSARAWIR
jgi:hypothetical protein